MLFANFQNILNAGQPFCELNCIFHRKVGIYSHFEELHTSSPLLYITNSVEDKKVKNNYGSPEDQLKKKGKRSHAYNGIDGIENQVFNPQNIATR